MTGVWQMKRTFSTAFATATVLTLLACAGCKDAHVRQEAKLLIVPATTVGKALQYVMAGTDKQLVDRGRISAHRRVRVDPNTEIDCWVIHSRLHDESGAKKGDLFERQITRGTVVLLHPLCTGKAWFLSLGEKLARRGWDVVLMDVRGHGFSDGEYITWGVREKQDIKRVMDRLIEAEPISSDLYVCGASMGGCVGVQYAAIDPRVRGVMALGPPAGARQAGRRMLWLVPRGQFEAALQTAGQMAHFNPEQASAVDAAKNLNCPLLVAHGCLDLLVPLGQGAEIFNAAPVRKKFLALRWAGHAPEIGRDGWLMDKIDLLAAMSRQENFSVRTVAGTRVDRRPAGQGGRFIRISPGLGEGGRR